jgi:hypothetical protein
LVDEENVGSAKIESWKNKNIDGLIFYTKTTQKEDSAKYNKTRVSIDDEYDRWNELKLYIAVITCCSASFGTAADS